MSADILALDHAWQAASKPPASPEKDPHKGTDLSNALLFAKRHREKLRYCEQWGKWLVWTGTHWTLDNRRTAERFAGEMVQSLYAEAASHEAPERRIRISKQANKLESRNALMSMLQLAKGYLAIEMSELDTDPWLLNCKNGTLDLRTGELYPHKPEDYITHCLDTAYEADAQCPAWASFLSAVFSGDEEIIKFAQRAVGYSLTGDVREQKLFMLWGAGSNGKSTFLEVLQGLLKGYAKQAAPNVLLAKRGDDHPTAIADLRGCHMVVCSESGEGRRLDETLVKQLTGGDLIRARHMRQDYFEFTPTHKLWLATNHRPTIKGTDHAIWRRILLVPFCQTFHEHGSGKTPIKDLSLKDKLCGELPGILAWAVRGCLAWQKDGLTPPAAVLQATEGYQGEMDVIASFIAERCVTEDGDAIETSKRLYEAYVDWCKENGETPEIRRKFGQRITEKGFQRYTSNGVRYRGIKLATEGTEPLEGFFPKATSSPSCDSVIKILPSVPSVGNETQSS
ncbi:phage/plasmid primase, P4 family [Ralstonia sp.]|uniref:DNA primase family protein n=1 Tax=Ralstonia sp. TaxID=54061 RepID=UPI0031D723F4